MVSISLSESLSDSEPEELSDPEDVSSLELSSFSALETAFTLFFWWLPGSGEVDERLELLSLSDEDEAAMAAMCDAFLMIKQRSSLQYKGITGSN